MGIPREQLFAALFDRIAAIPSLVTSGRRPVSWDLVPEHEQPALFLEEGDELVDASGETEARSALTASVYLYARGSQEITPGQAVTEILSQLEAKLGWQAGERFGPATTLGGLVEHARIEGTIQRALVSGGAQGVAIVPVSMLVAVALPTWD